MEALRFLVLALLAAVALLPKAESPSLSCPPGEYSNSAYCCKLCPAGTHVEEPCNKPHSLGRCQSCRNGEDYTETKNGLNKCRPCDTCKSGYKTEKPCTVTKNTECQCNDGTFRHPGYEECQNCMTQCPKGKVTLQKCNATADMKCGLPNTGNAFFLKGMFIPIAVIAAIAAIVGLLVLLCYKCRISSKIKEEEDAEVYLISGNTENFNSNAGVCAASQHELPGTSEGSSLELGRGKEDSSMANLSAVPSPLQPAIPNEHSNVLRINEPKINIEKLYSKELQDTYNNIYNIVGFENFCTLMRRCGLSDNEIEEPRCEHPHSAYEQHYQMLKTLRDRFRIDGAIYKILKGLQEMKLKGIYENLVNELKRQDLIIETED